MHKETVSKTVTQAGVKNISKVFSSSSTHTSRKERLFLACFFAGMLLLSIFHSPAYGGAVFSDVEKKEMYMQGTEYFQQAVAASESDPAAARDLYEKALLRFTRLTEEGGIVNGKLFYNIGNIYFLLDDIGRAILNYRRAEEYIPNDPNLAKNIGYARSVRLDKLEMQDQERILQTLFFFHYDLGTGTKLALFAIFYVFFWAAGALRIFIKRPFTVWVLGVALVSALMFGASLFVEARQAALARDGVILAPEVTGRQGDAESYEPSFAEPLHAGTEFSLREDRGAWWQIELPDGRSTWIPAKSGELVRLRNYEF